MSCDEANMIAIDVIYTKGDETSIQIKVEGTNDTTPASGSAWYQQITQTASGGTVTIAPAIYSMTAASAATIQNFTFIINPVKGSGFRISVQATGGTPWRSRPGTRPTPRCRRARAHGGQPERACSAPTSWPSIPRRPEAPCGTSSSSHSRSRHRPACASAGSPPAPRGGAHRS